MKATHQALFGLMMLILIALMVFGSIFSSLWESGALLAFAPQGSPSESVDFLATLLVTTTSEYIIPTTMRQTSVTSTNTSVLTPTWTASPFPSLTAACLPPPGWMQIVVRAGDTLHSLAHTYGASVDMLIQVNCLVAESIMPGSYLFVPARTPTVSPTRPVYFCGAPYGWVAYVIQPGDTLYRLAIAFRTTVSQLQNANCMGNSTLLIVGDVLYVPNVPTSTLPPTATLYPTLTATPQPSFTPSFTIAPSLTPTATASPRQIATMTPSSLPTSAAVTSPSPTETLADSGGG